MRNILQYKTEQYMAIMITTFMVLYLQYHPAWYVQF